MRLTAAIALSVSLFGTAAAAQTTSCPGNPGALGTSRVLKIDPREYARIGTVQYHDTLPLQDKEVVLTFDDGPMPPYTTRVLEALAQECVKANYFIVGRMARGYPDLLRRIAAEGHVIGTHSENHLLAFEKMPLRAVQQEIDQGFASTTAALGGQGTVAPFFRIPGLLRAEHVEGYLKSRNMVTWSADVVADDWKHITASEVVSRSIARLDARGNGILLLHDIQPATALALPHLLRELKRRGYKIVQVVPASAAELIASPSRTAPALAPTASATRPQPAPPAAARTPAQNPVPTPAHQQAEPPAEIQPPVQAAAPPVAQPAATQVVQPQTPPQRPRETGSWPTPYRVTTTITRTDSSGRTTTETFVSTDPNAPLPPGMTLPSMAGATSASPVSSAPPPGPKPAPVMAAPAAPRAVSPPVVETARPLPRAVVSRPEPASEPPSATFGVRPLMPGFKPSHSATQPTKVTDLPFDPPPVEPPQPEAQPPEPPAESEASPSAPTPAEEVPVPEPTRSDEPEPSRQIDSWSTRASLAPPPRQRDPWPLTASSLVRPTPR